MKKKIILLKAPLFLMLTILSISCSTSADDIKLNDLKTSCDYVDAMNKIYEQIIKIKGDTKVNELAPEKKSEMDVWTKKLKEIAQAAGKKYTEAEVKECTDFEKLKINRDIISDKKLQEMEISQAVRAKMIADSIDASTH